MKCLELADLFCGAGGTSIGAMLAGEATGHRVSLTAINHWDRAIATHTKNHPGARHLCTSVDDVNPRELYKPGELFLLWASPECTHHSRARGGKPMSEQSRATAHCVTRWAEALLPPVIMIENVPEFVEWGPLMRARRMVKVKWPKFTYAEWRRKHPKHRRKDWMKRCPKRELEKLRYVWVADPKRKGDTFRAWVAMLESLGYKVDWRILCAANYGDPTTRERLFVQCARGRRKIVWPDRTHAPVAELAEKTGDLFESKMKPWVAAREIIDWQLKGRWLDQMPGKKQYDGLPLSPKTLRRILTGFFKHGMKPFIVPPQGFDGRTRSTDRPLNTITCEARGIGLADPFVVSWDNQSGGSNGGARSMNDPLSTITSKARHGVAEPFIIGAGGPEYSAKPQSVNDPIKTILCENRKSLDPYVVKLRGGEDAHIEASGKSVEQPLDTLCAAGLHHAVVEPFLLPKEGVHGGNQARSVNDPLPTVIGDGRLHVVEPSIVPTNFGERVGQHPRSQSINDPLSTVVGSATHGLSEPFLVQVAHGDSGSKRDRSIDQPLNTIHGQSTDMALIETQVTKGDRSRSIAAPLPTVAGNRGDMALIETEAQLLGQQSCAAARPVSEPAPTIATAGAVALIDPYVVKFYGTANAISVDEPLDTVTVKDRFALVEAIIERWQEEAKADVKVRAADGPPQKLTITLEVNGERYLVRFRWRMLQPHELKLAHFPKSYTFTGNKTQIVKQIGNAVPYRTARALVLASITQNPDVSSFAV